MLTKIAHAQTVEQSPITSLHGNLSPQYVLDGACLDFSPTEDYIATETGLFATADGSVQIEFSEAQETIVFSPDGRWLVADGFLYEVATGEVVMARNPASALNFSMDGQYIHINYDTFAVDIWEVVEDVPLMLLFQAPDPYMTRYEVGHTFSLGNGIPSYLSPSRNFWVVVNFVDADEGTDEVSRGGIYAVSTGERLTLPDEINDPTQLDESFFSPDDAFFFSYSGVMYDTLTWEKQYQLDSAAKGQPIFSATGQYFTLSTETGIFATATGELVFPIDVPASVSSNGHWVVTSTTIYDLATGDIVFEADTPAPYGGSFGFSPDHQFALHLGDGLYDLSTGSQIITFDDSMRDYAFSADSTRLYVQTLKRKIWMYDLTDNESAQSFRGDTFELSPSDTLLAISDTLTDTPQCSIYAVQ